MNIEFYKSKYPLKQFHWDRHGRIAFIDEEMVITDPTRSTCGRFEMHPTKTYGISWLNAISMRLYNECLEARLGDKIYET